MTKAVWGQKIRGIGAGVAIAALSGCGQLTREGQASSYLIVSELLAAPGGDPSSFGATLWSDVETVKDDVPTIFADNGKITFTLAMKDAGSSSLPTTPTAKNSITLDQYHVQYTRSDGRNTQGVDVPYAFSGALSFTVSGEVSATFELVRHIAKKEAPLAALKSNGVILQTIAEITFYGHDQTGRSASTTAKITVEFGNFGDPK